MTMIERETIISLRRMSDGKEVAAIKGADASRAVQITRPIHLMILCKLYFPQMRKLDVCLTRQAIRSSTI